LSRPSFTPSTEVLVQDEGATDVMKSWRPSQKETKMMTNSKAGQSLRRTALSAAMLLIAAPAALADPPGYLFRDFADPAPATASAPIAPLQRNAANQEAARLASARAFANVAESSPRMAQEHHTCAVVLGLDPSERPYDTCIRSLDRSLSESDQAQRVESNRSACAQEGLSAGTPDFAACVVTAERSPTDARYRASIAAH